MNGVPTLIAVGLALALYGLALVCIAMGRDYAPI